MEIDSNQLKTNAKLRVLEFYSGIGGMHYALKLANKDVGFDYEVVEAFDINVNANKVYKLNYQKPTKTVSIETLTPKQLDKYNANAWLMSPPCQPYTRQGNQKGSTDNRSASFLHLVDLLPKLKFPPDYILLENVKGFELSDTHNNILIPQLSALGYSWQEFLLSPTQFSIPNSRLRFFLLAKRTPLQFVDADKNNKVRSYIPGANMYKVGDNEDITNLETIGKLYNSSRKISEFLENPQDLTPFMVPEQLVRRFGKLMDITTPSASRSVCFTKAYGKLCEGTGSVLQMADEKQTAIVEDPESWVALQLRYFTPREAANLHGFQADFVFSPDLTHRQCYQLVGNGLNVIVVAELIKYLIKEPIE